MIAINNTSYQRCQEYLAAYFKKCPNSDLRHQAYRVLQNLMKVKFLMLGKSGGWAGGIIYAVANLYQYPCGIPGLLNQECEEFFSVSMGTIHKRAAMIRKILTQ
jgi:hypothetical protein